MALTIPNVFVPHTQIKSSEVNENFDAIKTETDALDASVSALDGSVLALSSTVSSQGAAITSLELSAIGIGDTYPANPTLNQLFINTTLTA